jgi:hypothetical protein
MRRSERGTKRNANWVSNKTTERMTPQRLKFKARGPRRVSDADTPQ